MKTVNQILTMTATLAMAALTLVGCGKNDSGSNNNTVVGPYGYGACAACGANTQLLTTATATDYEGETLQLQLFGSAGSAINGQYYTGGNSQVAAQGVLTITQAPQYSLGCAIPNGQYQVQTATQPGYMSGNTIQGMNLIATGPNQVQIQMTATIAGNGRMVVSGVMVGQGAQQQCSLSMF